MATLPQKVNLLRGLLTGETAYAGPFFVTIDVTRRCNLTCLGCRYHSSLVNLPAPGDPAILEISFDLVEKLSEELAAMGTTIISFMGEGESMVIPQFTIAFAPLMITLQTQGKTKILRQWTQQLIDGLTVGGMFVVFGVLLLGNNLVPLVLGAAYQPVAANLLPLSIMLWAQVLSSVAILLTLVYNYPKTAVMSAVIRLAALWIFGPFLIAK